MLFLINKLKSAFNINKAANKRRIEFKKVVWQFNKLMLIIKLKPALINARLQKSVQSKDKKLKSKWKKAKAKK